MGTADRLGNKAVGISKSIGGNAVGAASCAIGYLRSRGFRRIGRDLSRRMSRNPVPSLFAMTAFGFLAGFLARRR